MPDLKSRIARNMLYYRKRLGLTQVEVAKRAQIAQRSYHRAETGLDNIRLDTLESISTALEIPTIELFREPGYRTKPTKEDAIEVILDALGIDPKKRRGPKKTTESAKTGNIEDPK